MLNSTKNDFSGSNGNVYRPDTIVIINCALNAPLMLVSIIGNSLVLAAILRTPAFRSPSMILLGSLATSDLLVGFVAQPLYIAYELTKNRSMFLVHSLINFSLCGVSFLIMTAISVDRFLALHYHMRYPELMTTQRVLYISAIVWLINIVLPFSIFLNGNAYLFAMAFSIAMFLLLSTTCYKRIYRIVLQHQHQIHAQQQAVANFTAENQQNVQQSKKNALNTFIYYIVMILCYTPLFTSILISDLFNVQLTGAWRITDTFVFLNSSINPILYCWRLRELRAAVAKTARIMLCKQT